MSLLIKGATNFLSLTDTPAAYAAQAGKGAKVKAAEDGLEFGTVLHTFTQIYDGETPGEGYLNLLGMLPYAYAKGSTGVRSYFMAVHNGEVYVGGGDPTGMPVPTEHGCAHFWKYNLTTKVWTKLAPLPAQTAFWCRAAYYNNYIYTICSTDNDGATWERLFRYDIVNDSWTSYDGVPAQCSFSALICPTAAHLIVVAGFKDKLYEIEYASLDTWNYKCAVTDPGTAQVITDEVYILAAGYANMQRYDEPTEALVDTGIVKPANTWSEASVYVEDEDAIWCFTKSAGVNWKWYKSDGAGAFTLQLDYGSENNTICMGGHGVQPSGWTDWFLSYSGTGAPADLPNAAYAILEIAGVWELVSQAFQQGDFLVINPDGAEVHASVSGKCKIIADAYLAYIVTAAETWDFTLSKDYDYLGVDIFRAT